jgi:hypothetical protein
LRVARDYRVPPSRYLQLPWPEWGETDFGLTQAFDWYQQNLCPCGCGYLRDDCADPDKAGRWQPVVETAYAGAALREFMEAHPDLPAGALVGVRLLPEGETPTDPLEFNADDAAAEFAEMQKRFGLA